MSRFRAEHRRRQSSSSQASGSDVFLPSDRAMALLPGVGNVCKGTSQVAVSDSVSLSLKPITLMSGFVWRSSPPWVQALLGIWSDQMTGL